MSSSNAMAYLNVPSNRMARSTSHESFATDVSCLSLSSFTPSDVGSRTKLDDRIQTSDDIETDTVSNTNPVMIKLRENMLEQMLECDSLSLQKLPDKSSSTSHNRQRSMSNDKSNVTASSTTMKNDDDHLKITSSEKDLIRLCGEPKSRGSMYKSFSTTDLTFTIENFDLSLVKHCTSQAWIPSDYAQIVQCRKKHLKDLKEQNSVDIAQFAASIEADADSDFKSSSNAGQDEKSSRCGDRSIADDQGKNRQPRLFDRHRYGGEPGEFTCDANRQQFFCRKAASDENIPRQGSNKRIGGIFMKKLKFSKEIGRRIKDDLLRKLGKHKQHLITSVDLEQEKGRPLSSLERNFIIFHWLQSLEDQEEIAAEK